MYATNTPEEGSDAAPEQLVAGAEHKKFALMCFRERRAKLEDRDVRLAGEIELEEVEHALLSRDNGSAESGQR